MHRRVVARPFRPTLPGLVAGLLLFVPHAGTAQIPTLEPGRTLQGTLASGDTVSYAFEAGEEWFIFGVVDQISVDVVVRVLDPAGEQRALFDGPARGAERFTGETREAGRYTVQVIPFEDGAGDYTITLHRAEPVETDPGKLAEQLMSPYAGDDTPGAALHVWRDGRTVYSRAWGMADLAHGIPFGTDTRTNIGSTSKQFTAFAVLLQAERGALSLDDDIRIHLPELPEFEHPITIRHLLTHTSGLREVFNLLAMTGRRIDHGDYVDRDEVLAVVRRQPALQNEPGAEWNYNNTAFALAALIVERTSGQDFDEFMRRNVFEPLEMTRTMVRPEAEAVVPGRSQGYAPGGRGYREIRDLGAAVGAGGIYSTVEDLRRWLENYQSPTVGTPEMVTAMSTSYVLTNGDSTGYGYGLFIDDQKGLKRVHHGGADIAHRSMLAWYPEIDAGITTQSNHASFDSGVAFRLAEAFFADAMEAESDEEGPAVAAAFDPETYDAEAFDELAGRYALDVAPEFILTFFREGDTLFTQATGQGRVEIVPTSDSTFALTVVDASVTFHRNDDGEVDALTLFQNGEQRATRLEGDAPAEWEPSPEVLAGFTGRYYSEEIETFFDVAVDDEALVARQRRLEDVSLTPGEEDTFTGGNLTFTFERDRNGLVIGFYLSNGRTRNVRFERQR